MAWDTDGGEGGPGIGDLFLVFEAGDDRYAIEARNVEEVLPVTLLKRVPHAPEAICGLMDHRGTPVPVVDANQLLAGHPSERRLSTRVILVRHPDGAGGTRSLGLMAERVTDTIRRKRSDFVSGGVAPAGAEYLGPVATDPGGMIQWIEPSRVLSAAVARALFQTIKDRDEIV